MTPAELQQLLFSEIRLRMADPKLIAEEIAGLLDISTDSVYRRMRGEKTISLEELYILCTKYQVSLDALMNIHSNAFLFQGRIQERNNFQFKEYLNGILEQVKLFNSFQEKELYYLAKDIPLFYHFHSRELAAFKYFFWMRTILKVPSFVTGRIRLSDYPDELFDLGIRIRDFYHNVDSVEFWNMETLHSTLRQVDFYRDGQLFENREDIWKIYDGMEKMLSHVEKQAEAGYKYHADDPECKPLSGFQLYFNEIILADNSILVYLDQSKIAFVLHSAINWMMTRNVMFCDHMQQYMQTLMEKSTLLSISSEKERARFFRLTREKIANRKNSL